MFLFTYKWKIRLLVICLFYAFFTDNSGITRLIFTCYVSSVIGFSIIATHIYASSSVFGVYSDVKFVDAWSWWALQTLMRSEELAVVIVVICVAKRSLLPEDALKRLASCLMCWNKNNARARKVHVVPMDESTVGQTNTVNIESLSTNSESKRQHCRWGKKYNAMFVCFFYFIRNSRKTRNFASI